MFDVSWGEMLIVGAVALVVIGPKDLPRALRTVGQMVGKVRRMAGEFQGQFNEAMREAEVAELRREMEEMKAAASGIGNGTIAPPPSASPTASQYDEPLVPPLEPLPPLDLTPPPAAGDGKAKPAGAAAKPAGTEPAKPVEPAGDKPAPRKRARPAADEAPVAAGPAAAEGAKAGKVKAVPAESVPAKPATARPATAKPSTAKAPVTKPAAAARPAAKVAAAKTAAVKAPEAAPSDAKPAKPAPRTRTRA